ncbi:MAG: sulfatase-like hydrolase/transferase [Lentisphaerae bacterium]|nr:sulfatase-like hydrolase/transferase [Lentisphaerota bacterium]
MSARSQDRTRPNVMFIIADQHNAKCLGSAGHPQVQTPHLDEMASKGTRFTRAVTTSPICAPSRISYLTGQYSHNHGHYGNGGCEPDKLPSLLAHLRAHGCRTASIGHINEPGHWQTHESDFLRDAYPPSDGNAGGNFDRSPYDDYLAEAGLEHLRDDCFYPEQGKRPDRHSVDGRPSPLPFEYTVEGWCVKEIEEFVDTCGEQPWFCYLAFPHPHSNYAPAQQFWDLYDHDSIWLPPSIEYDASRKAPHLRAAREWYSDGDWTLFEPRTHEAGRKRKQHGYLGCVSQVDHAVGRVMAFLAERQLLDNTIVVYTADHGDYACEHDLMEKAPGICGDGVCRVPSIWHWNGHFAEDHVSDAVVQNVDLAPTLCSLLELPPMRTVDGEDISDLLRGNDAPVREFGVTEHPWSRAILKGDWRLVYYPRKMFAEEFDGKVFGELYNLKDDPWEMNNLYFEQAHQEKVRELERDLMDWLVTTTSVKTVLPPPPPHTGTPHQRNQRMEADGKLHWRDVAGLLNQNKSYL